MLTTIDRLIPMIAFELHRGIFSLQTLLCFRKRKNLQMVADHFQMGIVDDPRYLIILYTGKFFGRLSHLHTPPRNCVYLVCRYGDDREFVRLVEQDEYIWVFGTAGVMAAGNLERLKVIIERTSSRINISGFFIRSAVQLGHLHIIKYLLERIDQTERSDLFDDLIDIATKSGHTEILNILNDYRELRA